MPPSRRNCETPNVRDRVSGILTPRATPVISTLSQFPQYSIRRLILEGQTHLEHVKFDLYLHIDTNLLLPGRPLKLLENANFISSDLLSLTRDGMANQLAPIVEKLNVRVDKHAGRESFILPSSPSSSSETSIPRPHSRTSVMSGIPGPPHSPVSDTFSDTPSDPAILASNKCILFDCKSSQGEYLVHICFTYPYINANPEFGPCAVSIPYIPPSQRNTLTFTVTGDFAKGIGIETGWDIIADPVRLDNFQSTTLLFADGTINDLGEETLSGPFTNSKKLTIKWARRFSNYMAAVDIDRVRTSTIVNVEQNGVIKLDTKLQFDKALYKGVKPTVFLQICFLCDAKSQINADSWEIIGIEGDAVKSWQYLDQEPQESNTKGKWDQDAPNLWDEKLPNMSLDECDISLDLPQETVKRTKSQDGSSLLIDLKMDSMLLNNSEIRLVSKTVLPDNQLANCRISIPSIFVVASEIQECEVLLDSKRNCLISFYDIEHPFGWARVDINGKYDPNSWRWKAPPLDQFQMASAKTSFFTFKVKEKRLVYQPTTVREKISKLNVHIDVQMEKLFCLHHAEIVTHGSKEFVITFANEIHILLCKLNGIERPVALESDEQPFAFEIMMEEKESMDAKIEFAWKADSILLPHFKDHVNLYSAKVTARDDIFSFTSSEFVAGASGHFYKRDVVPGQFLQIKIDQLTSNVKQGITELVNEVDDGKIIALSGKSTDVDQDAESKYHDYKDICESMHVLESDETLIEALIPGKSKLETSDYKVCKNANRNGNANTSGKPRTDPTKAALPNRQRGLQLRQQQLSIVAIVVAIISIILFYSVDLIESKRDVYDLDRRLLHVESLIYEMRNTFDQHVAIAGLCDESRNSSAWSGNEKVDHAHPSADPKVESLRENYRPPGPPNYSSKRTNSIDIIRPTHFGEHLVEIYYSTRIFIQRLWDRLLNIRYY